VFVRLVIKYLFKSIIGTFNFIRYVSGFIVSVVVFLAALVEIAAFTVSPVDTEYYRSYIVQNVKALASRIATDNKPKDCRSYIKVYKDLRCEEKENIADRLLCKATIRPVENVCDDK